MRKMKFGILLVIALLALVSVASAFPATITASSITYNFPTSYFKVVTANGDSDVPAGPNDAWCIGLYIHGISPGTYDAFDSRTVTPADLPVYINTVNWNKINWILNNHNADWKITQAAIWKLDGGSGDAFPTDGRYTNGYSETEFTNYMELVNAQGGFVPSEGQQYAVILVRDEPLAQPIIIPAIVPGKNVPEFPTVALPVAMLIGVVGLVEYIRTKKE